jgi:putative flippase GtrA
MTRLVCQFSSFAGVGIVATSVHYGLLIGLVEVLDVSAVAAAMVGCVAGAVVSYGLNRRHTFHSNLPHQQAGRRFAIVALGGFGLTYLFMSFFVDFGGVPYLPAQAATTGIVMLWSFLGHRMWTFA